MADTVIKTTFQFRRGLAATWTSKNPILAYGEPGFEKDTYRLKIGDGVTAWNDLAYFAGGGGTGDYDDLTNKPITNLATGAIMTAQDTGIYKVAAGTWKMTADDSARDALGDDLFYVYKNTTAGTTSVTHVRDSKVELFTVPTSGSATSIVSKTLLAYEDLVSTF